MMIEEELVLTPPPVKIKPTAIEKGFAQRERSIKFHRRELALKAAHLAKMCRDPNANLASVGEIMYQFRQQYDVLTDREISLIRDKRDYQQR